LRPWNSLSPRRIAQRIERVEATWQAAGTASAPEAAVTAATLFARAGLVPDAWQTQVCTTPGNQLVLCHRQSGKSTTFAALGLEMACQKAEAVVLLLSPSLRQSGELFRKVKTFYNATHPLPLLQDSALSLELANHSRIVSLPGTADTIVGFSAVDLLILDEAARIPDETYYAIRPMLAMSKGRLPAIPAARIKVLCDLVISSWRQPVGLPIPDFRATFYRLSRSETRLNAAPCRNQGAISPPRPGAVSRDRSALPREINGD
jgi:hypothetical protein